MPYRTMNLEEVAAYLHLAVSDVEMLVRRHEVPVVKQGERLTFRQSEVDVWASRRILGLADKHLEDFHHKSSVKAHDLSKNHAIVPELLQASSLAPSMTCRTKASLIRELVGMAEQTGLVCYPDDLLASVEERERMCSTALPGGVALLHPKCHEPYMFEDSFIVAGRTIQPIPFGSPDGATSNVFFLACCQDDRIHLHTLARLCMMCQRTSLLLELSEAHTAERMFEVIVASEAEVISRLPT